jgi:aspartate kinase
MVQIALKQILHNGLKVHKINEHIRLRTRSLQLLRAQFQNEFIGMSMPACTGPLVICELMSRGKEKRFFKFKHLTAVIFRAMVIYPSTGQTFHQMKTLVIKFGGAAVATTDSFAAISEIVIARQRDYDQIVVVVSAMGDTTDQLDALARKVHPNPPRREYDMLVTVGERISISLLAMALAAKQRDAISFTGSQSGIITCNRHSNAQIIEVRPHRLLPHLAKGKVIIVAGFQGVSREGEITTLGRGGSDTTAVALGVALNACGVEFFKDVAGIYSADPKKDAEAQLLAELTYAQALKIVEQTGRPVLHPRCIRLAEKNHLRLFVRSFQTFDGQNAVGTVIGALPSEHSPCTPRYEDLE